MPLMDDAGGMDAALALEFLAPVSYPSASISHAMLSLPGAQEAQFWQQAPVLQSLVSWDAWVMSVSLATNVLMIAAHLSSGWQHLLLLLVASQLLFLGHRPRAYAKHRHAIATFMRLALIGSSPLLPQASRPPDRLASGRWLATAQLLLLPVAQPLSYFFYHPLPFAHSLPLGVLKTSLDLRLLVPGLCSSVRSAREVEGIVRRACTAVEVCLSGLAQAFTFVGGDEQGVCGSVHGVHGVLFVVLLFHMYAGCALPLLLGWHAERRIKLRHLGLLPLQQGLPQAVLWLGTQALVLLLACASLAAVLAGTPATQQAGW
jgi:hypothetical protein